MPKISKNYMIPTKHWLKPIKLLLKQSGTLIMVANLIENKIKQNEVIVKITKPQKIQSNSKFIHNIINKSKHIIDIYGFISCYENNVALTEEYKGFLSFCNSTHSEHNNTIINLEIMKKYSRSLNSFLDKLDKDNMLVILKYLLLMQLDLFNNFGFIHKDLHIGNILMEKNKDNKKIKFNLYDKEKEIESSILFLFSDFEYSKILFDSLDKDIKKYLSNNDHLRFENTIEFHINKTFEECIRLLKDYKLQTQLAHKLSNWQTDEISLARIKLLAVKNLTDYALGYKNEKDFCRMAFENCMDIIYNLYKHLLNISFF